MSSTRFNPPVPTFEEINPDTGARTSDDDGFIVPGENDYAGPTNRRNLGSYLSSLTRGEVPTEGIVEYNGPVPTHGNAYPIGDASGNPSLTFTELGIEGGGVNELDNYSNSGLFDGAVTDKNLSDVINKGKLGLGRGQETLSGHLLLPGIGSIRPSEGGKAYEEIISEILQDKNPNNPDAPAISEVELPFNPLDVEILRGPSSRVKVSSGESVSFPSSAPTPTSGKISITELSKVAADIMLRSTGKANGPDQYGEFTAGFIPSTVQTGVGRVDTEDLRARNYAGLSGLNSTVDGVDVSFPKSDGVGETRYSDKSYGNTYNYLENFTDLNSGVTAFAALGAGAFAAVLALLAIFSIDGVGEPSSNAPTYSNTNGGASLANKLTLGSFEMEANSASNADGKLASILKKAQDIAGSAGIETDITKLLNFYSPTNSSADYGQCVIIGFASVIGAEIDDELILAENLKINNLQVRSLSINIGLRFLGIALTSDKGYYMNLFREIMKDSGAIVSGLGDIGLSNFIPTLAGAKVVRFIDSLARIGDLIVLQARAKTLYAFNQASFDPYATGFNFTDARGGDEELAKSFARGRIRGRHVDGRRSSLGVGDLPSAHLLPKSYHEIFSDLKLRSFNAVSGSIGRTNLRLSNEDVARAEDVLNAEYMPFYFHDLRTNEIIAFHAFLEDLSDSYSAEYNSTSGYGRVEDIRMYKSTKRSVGCTFQIVAANEKDFDYMWWQINKLTTMVYPQWSQGRSVTYKPGEDNFKFTQPFSQIPTATPVIRVRVGDLIRSNYSRFNLKRIFGYQDSDKEQKTAVADNRQAEVQVESARSEYYSVKAFDDRGIISLPTYPPVISASKKRGKKTYEQLHQPVAFVGSPGTRMQLIPDPSADIAEYLLDKFKVYFVKGDSENRRVVLGDSEVEIVVIPAEIVTVDTYKMNVNDFYKYDNNSVIKSFESTMGMGLAAVVTQLQFTWMDGLWGAGTDGPGHRAPRSCKVQMSFEPMHDIAPGLDHEGLNRAPIYPVGNLVNHLVEGGGNQPEPYGRFSKSALKKE